MNNSVAQRIVVLTYTVPHRKTYDTLCLLKAKGYNQVVVLAQPMTYVKKRQPIVKHRPETYAWIPATEVLCKNLGYQYIAGEFENIVCSDYCDSIFLLCGAGLLPDSFVKTHRIINAHPGYIPYARGLDAYKWSVYKGLPIGVSSHFLGEYVDAGEVIERRLIEISPYDTFHSIAQRIYENEIAMLVGAIEKANEKHEMIIPEIGSEPFKRMPAEMEEVLFEKFECLK